MIKIVEDIGYIGDDLYDEEDFVEDEPDEIESDPYTAKKSKLNIVKIVYDPSKGKLRAQADDGIHGTAWVSFPVGLRIPDATYEVGSLVWNGKNYRVSGYIHEI